MRKIILLTLALLFQLASWSQRKIILEQVRAYSMLGPVIYYWNDDSFRNTFREQLNEQLQRHTNTRMYDTSLNVLATTDNNKAKNKNIYFTISDTSTWHLYLDVYEYEPQAFFSSQPQFLADSLLFKRSASVFHLGVMIADHDKKVFFNETLIVSVTRGSTNGLGVIPPDLVFTNKGFADMLKLGFNKLLDKHNEEGMIEIKASPPFFADNFILPKMRGVPVTQTRSQKDIFSYVYNGRQEMIRLGDTFYEEIITRGKNKSYQDNSPLEQAINATGYQKNSDFIQLRQECRDVIRNENYTIKLLNQINPDFVYISETEAFTHFLPGNVHVLLKDKDTLARFSIVKSIGVPEKKLYIGKITNGYDSSSLYNLMPTSASRNMIYEYVIQGTLNDKPFTIRCGDLNQLKEIEFDQKEIGLARGRYLPERFVIFDASLSIETFNQLLIIAFTRFYR